MKVALIISLLMSLLVSGCGYTLQGRSELPFDTVSIGAIQNATVEPKLQDRMSRLLAESLMEYGFDVRQAAAYRIEVTIVKFDLVPVSEKSLTAIEYQITVVGDFRVVDVRTQQTQPLLGVASPFITYFRSSGSLVSVLAQKEAATESALRDLSQELVRRIIYLKPGATAATGTKKGEQTIEPQTVPTGK
ncbi:MAG TPA: LPS assembly lipoprotein LptE [Dissulfurispiraceae bacterium]|nr:LPS assembly lipoprotein LptE [Dissulfurispiraceae bacterium]